MPGLSGAKRSETEQEVGQVEETKSKLEIDNSDTFIRYILLLEWFLPS